MTEYDPDRDEGTEPELPGFEGFGHLWPPVDGHRVTKVLMAIAGQVDLTKDPALANALALEGQVELVISATLSGKAFKLRPSKNGVRQCHGVVTLSVTDIRPSDAMRERLRHIWPIDGSVTAQDGQGGEEKPKSRSRRQKVVIDVTTGIVEGVETEGSELDQALAQVIDP